MSRRGAAKMTAGQSGTNSPRPAATPSPPLVRPTRPRRGSRPLLAASSLLFIVWLAVLAWLAFC